MNTLEIIDGVPCVAYSDSVYSEPVLITHFWPIGNLCLDIARQYEGRPVQGDGHLGNFGLSLRPYGHKTLILVDGGKTKPIKTVKKAIPPPKTSRETRYRDGRWQKLLKRGWVAA